MGLFPRPRPHRRGAQEDHEGLGGVSLLRIGIVIVRQAPLTRSGAQSRAKSPRKCRDAVSGAWRTTAPRRGVFWRMAASRVGHDESSSLPPCSYPCAKIRLVPPLTFNSNHPTMARLTLTLQ